MADEDEDLPPEEEKSMPGWVMTFADLMSLLMCFFVLLLSFSEMDLQKFKQVAGSMEKAFGIQRSVEAKEAPRGVSIIAKEFSPGKPEPTPINEIRQSTTADLEEMLKIEKKVTENDSGVSLELASTIAMEFVNEIKNGNLEVEVIDDNIILRILEKGSFPSGTANLKTTFLPILNKISKVLGEIPGRITVSGFTDNIPIQNDLFRSNWELSAVRAFVVINEILKNPDIESRRITLEGHGANRAIAPNDTADNQAKNRRVEIQITQGEEHLPDPDEVIEVDKDAVKKLLPDIDKLLADEENLEPTFPENFELTSDGTENYLEEDGELGLFKEEALYDYELTDSVIKEEQKLEEQSTKESEFDYIDDSPPASDEETTQIEIES